MTTEQEKLVKNLRLKLLRAGYPDVLIVSLQELEAAEEHLREWLTSEGKDPILLCGDHGLFFKGVQLVLEVKT
jgi:hypothetical protein